MKRVAIKIFKRQRNGEPQPRPVRHAARAREADLAAHDKWNVEYGKPEEPVCAVGCEGHGPDLGLGKWAVLVYLHRYSFHFPVNTLLIHHHTPSRSSSDERTRHRFVQARELIKGREPMMAITQ